MHGREERCAWPMMKGAHGGWMVEELKWASRESMELKDDLDGPRPLEPKPVIG
tara:strand:- start:3 stop:161 length:159 start_codon:yes stop_codon:yes gene_type:complete